MPKFVANSDILRNILKMCQYNALQMKGWWKSNINVWFPSKYSQKLNCALVISKQNYNVLSPISYTHISVRDWYISRMGLSIFAAAKYVDWSSEYINRNWDRGREIFSQGIYNSDFLYGVEITIGKIAWNFSAKTSAYQNITYCSLRNMFIVYFAITLRTWLYPALRGDIVQLFPDTPHRNF